MTERPSLNFCQVSVQSGDLSSTVNFECSQKTFHQILSIFRATKIPSFNFCKLLLRPIHIPSTSDNLQCRRESFCELLSTFLEAGRLLSTSIKLPFDLGTFHQLPSTLLADGRPSVNFCQLSVRRGGIPSTFVKSRKFAAS